MCYPPPEATHEQVQRAHNPHRALCLHACTHDTWLSFDPMHNMLFTPMQVFADAAVFQRTLEHLHQRLGIKVKVPRVNGVEVDLHLLYKEVTKLGGLQPVITRKQWVLVCDPFNFPQSFTNRSFVIKKLYITALHHYEQLYFHRRQGALVPCNTEGDKHAAHTPKRKEPEGSHLAAIIPEPGSPALPHVRKGRGSAWSHSPHGIADVGAEAWSRALQVYESRLPSDTERPYGDGLRRTCLMARISLAPLKPVSMAATASHWTCLGGGCRR